MTKPNERVEITITRATREPVFFRVDDGTVMFQFVVDLRNVIGPREATDRDKADHPAAWATFRAHDPATDIGSVKMEQPRAKRAYVRRQQAA